ncbi:hypothetical protein CISG_00230 [Coccidioides immitis RMSCC 3703]|uniref:Uncharacterized protein n=1 Tax=Coccidioides immitis RMSCC 3703 TaxID=454286 RepID=A0A0J8QHG2_COCIT|nr:hypothetical protein CISG_00230 [Coccidioides immitis RMSCC 3703]
MCSNLVDASKPCLCTYSERNHGMSTTEKNIARVRRDEALAKDREEENERREQEVVAERRIDFLRNQRPTSPLSQQDFSRDIAATKAPTEVRHRKRRRLAGEDDTDRDIRLAREDVLLRAGSSREITSRKPMSNAPLVDSSGHISLFPRKADERPGKNDEAEAEAAKAKREYEDQYTMRFSNAAGYKQGMEAPWSHTETDRPNQRMIQIVAMIGAQAPMRRIRVE